MPRIVNPNEAQNLAEFTRNQQGERLLDVRRPLRIYFPPNPPPLGVPINATEDYYPNRTLLEPLETEILEPYFAPLSTRLIEPDVALSKSLRDRLAAYRAARGRALADLRQMLISLATVAPAERASGLAAFAVRQRADLVELEARAERLRADLATRVSWYALRHWRLGQGNLELPRRQTRVLEFALVRAAAFYQDGLSPAQRRLLREAAELVEETVFRGDKAAQPAAMFPYFSPDLLRSRVSGMLPPDVASALDDYRVNKDALRREVQDAVYEAEALEYGPARRRKLEDLAKRQAPRIDALEALADKIRPDLAPLRATWARPRPVALPADLEATIADYESERRHLQDGWVAILQPIISKRPSAPKLKDPDALSQWKEKCKREIERAQQEYEGKQTELITRLGVLLAEIDARIVPYLNAAEVKISPGSSARRLGDFLRRRREELAYYEYETAAYEPGLSPEQRRLLFAGAVVRLQVPLPEAELQPVEAPKTMLR